MTVHVRNSGRVPKSFNVPGSYVVLPPGCIAIVDTVVGSLPKGLTTTVGRRHLSMARKVFDFSTPVPPAIMTKKAPAPAAPEPPVVVEVKKAPEPDPDPTPEEATDPDTEDDATTGSKGRKKKK